MASIASIFLQGPNFKWKNHSQYFPPQLPPQVSFGRSHIKIRQNLKKLGVKYLSTNDQQLVIKFGKLEIINQNPIEMMAEAVKNMLRKTAAAAVVVGLLLMYDPNSALAASGGRMDGSSFSSSSRSSSSSSGSYSSSSWSYSNSTSSHTTNEEVACFIVIMIILIVVLVLVLSATDKTSVLKIQVGLLGSGRSLQKDLNKIAEVADTSTSAGLHYVLTETAVALLRHPDYFISVYSSVDVKRNKEEGEIFFNQLSIEERGKFDEETLVNVDNIKKQSSTIQREGGFSNEYIVITILVAAEGEQKLPSINNSIDLKEALQKLASIPSSRTKAVEVLWTPQNEDDTLSKQELLENYPLLRPL